MSPHKPAEQRLEELSLLYEAWRAISATLDLDRVSELIARTAATTLRARTAILRLAEGERGELRVAARFDADGGAPCAAADGPVAEAVRRETAPLLMPDLRQDARFAAQAGGEAAPALCAPLLHQGIVLGTLGLYGRVAGAPGEPATFGEVDLQLLMAFSAQAAVAIENARLFQEARMRSARLNALSELSRTVTSSLDLQQVFDYIVWAAVDLLALARARVYVWQEATGLLHLRASAGAPDLLPYPREAFKPGEGVVGTAFNSLTAMTITDAGDDPAYAEQAWARQVGVKVNESRRVLEGRMGVGPSSGEEAARVWSALESPSRSLREVIAERAAHLREGADAAFDRLARSLVVPLRPDAGVLALTTLEARPFRIAGARRDPRVRPAREGRLDVEEFACVPLVAKGKVVGVIAVDNKCNGKPITDEDLELLSVFATQAGLAVEGARVYTRLEEASRDVQGMSREVQPALVETDLHTLLQDCLVLFAERIAQQRVQLRMELAERPPVLPLDPVQLKQAMVNLLANALEAMTHGGTLTIATRLARAGHGELVDPSPGESGMKERRGRAWGSRWSGGSFGPTGDGWRWRTGPARG